VCVVAAGMCLVKECSHKIKIEFEEIKRTATVKQLHLFCCDEAFTHQVGCIYVSDSHTVELKCRTEMYVPSSLSLSCLSFFHQQNNCETLSCEECSQTKLDAFMFLTLTLSKAGMCLVKECSHEIKIEFEEIRCALSRNALTKLK
jgi:hypothetical protein